MSTSNCEWTIYVGQLIKCLRNRDVKTIFEHFGKVMRVDIKYETELAYAFIDFEVRESAENCIRFANGWQINGHSIEIEWAKGKKDVDRSSQNLDMCLRCRRKGHWAQDCPEVGRLGRRGGGGSKSPMRRRHRCHSRSHDHRRRSRSNDKERSRSHSGDRKRFCSGSSRSRSASNNRKTSRAPGVGP